MSQSTIAIVYGRMDADAPADEKDVMTQVETVRAALRVLGHRTIDVPLSLDLGASAAALRSAGPVIAFNLAETVDGKGSLVHLAPTLLDSLGIPYTGAHCEAILLTSHKLLAKRTLAAAGIATPRWMTAAEARAGGLPFPPAWIVKSVWEHASIGLEDSAVARSGPGLLAEIDRRSRREPLEHLFAEEYIEGREFNLAFLGLGLGGRAAAGPQNLPPAEIQFVGFPEGKPRMVGYRAKWEERSFEYGSTPRRFDFPPEDAALVEELVRLACECWRVFGLRGYARVDFRVDGAGKPWVLEINTNPCLSPDAGFMAAAGRAGLTMNEVIRRIVAEATSASAACKDGEERHA